MLAVLVLENNAHATGIGECVTIAPNLTDLTCTGCDGSIRRRITIGSWRRIPADQPIPITLRLCYFCHGKSGWSNFGEKSGYTFDGKSSFVD